MVISYSYITLLQFFLNADSTAAIHLNISLFLSQGILKGWFPLAYKYLLLTEFESTVSYGSSFFLLRFMSRALRAWAKNRRGKNEDP